MEPNRPLLDIRHWWGLLLAVLACAGCALVADGLPVGTPVTGTDPALRDAPERWQMSFCDAQVVMRRLILTVERTERQLDRPGSAIHLEDVGDDLADTAERTLAYFDAVPTWRPATFLVEAERAVVDVAFEAGERIEAIAMMGGDVRTSRVVRAAIARLGESLDGLEQVIVRGERRGIPCARPAIPTTEELLRTP